MLTDEITYQAIMRTIIPKLFIFQGKISRKNRDKTITKESTLSMNNENNIDLMARSLLIHALPSHRLDERTECLPEAQIDLMKNDRQ